MSDRSETGKRNPFRAETAMAAAVVVVIFMIVIPLPYILLDFFLALQLALALLILFLSIGILKVSDFSIFPTVLLLATVLGLALNISSTRLILQEGSKFDGKLIRAFGSFVTGGGGTKGILVGSMIFVIIIAVQLIVITKGSGRIAEVAARFSLDALPGRQMSIDSELNSGLIGQGEASARKSALRREADFYGQMDGASKFVSGNAKVAILITLVDIFGGFIVGMTSGEDFSTALATYTTLTIGDGLSSQLPALLISVAAGIVVTRADSGDSFASLAKLEFGARKGIFTATGIVLALMAFLPGFPWKVLLPLAAVSGYIGLRKNKTGSAAKSADPKAVEPKAALRPGKVSDSEASFQPGGDRTAQTFSSVAPPDPFSLELGYGLVHIALDPDSGSAPAQSASAQSAFMRNVTEMRTRISLETGVPIPPLHVVDSPKLADYGWTVRIRGDKVAGGIMKPGRVLAVSPSGTAAVTGGTAQPAEGAGWPEGKASVPSRDPRTGRDAFWIASSVRIQAEERGFEVVTHPEILLGVLDGCMRSGAAGFLGRQEVQALTADLAKEYPAVVSGLLSVHSHGDVQRVLQMLLREKVSIRNTVTIFETLADHPEQPKDHIFLAEKARQALGRQIWLACLESSGRNATGKRADADEVLDVFTLAPPLVRDLAASAVRMDAGIAVSPEPGKHKAILDAVGEALAISGLSPDGAVLVCPGQIRVMVRTLTERRFPGLAVLSSQELPAEARMRTVAEIALPD